MKVGDRVRHTGGSPCLSRKGWKGTVTDLSSPGNVRVLFDEHQGDYGVMPENLEIIMPALDVTKPLETVDKYGDKSEVIFITLTSPDNHIMIAAQGSAHWIIFDQQGKWVKASAGQGSALTLQNKAERKVMYQRIEQGRVQGLAFNSKETAICPGEKGIALTIENGVVVGVELVK